MRRKINLIQLNLNKIKKLMLRNIINVLSQRQGDCFVAKHAGAEFVRWDLISVGSYPHPSTVSILKHSP